MGEKGGRVFMNICEGHMDKSGGGGSFEGGRWDGWVGGELGGSGDNCT